LSNEDSEDEVDFRDTPSAHRIKSSRPYQWWDAAAMLLISADKVVESRWINRARNNGCVVITDRYPTVDPDLPDGPHLDDWRDSSNIIKR
jgi:hypothetical protein